MLQIDFVHEKLCEKLYSLLDSKKIRFRLWVKSKRRTITVWVCWWISGSVSKQLLCKSLAIPPQFLCNSAIVNGVGEEEENLHQNELSRRWKTMRKLFCSSVLQLLDVTAVEELVTGNSENWTEIQELKIQYILLQTCIFKMTRCTTR